jgi:protease I
MRLKGQRILILVEENYEDLELHYPRLRLREEGAEVVVGGTGKPSYTGKRGTTAKADADVKELKAEDFHGVVIPGGWAPDKLRISPAVLRIVRDLNKLRRPIAAICHAGSVLVSADVVRGRRVTSYVSVADDLRLAGAEWVDAPVMVDGNLVTSRVPDDLPDFSRELIAQLERVPR